MQRNDAPMTGTELLIATLDRLKLGEAEDMIIAWTDDKGCCRVKTNCSLTRAIGLAHWVEAEMTSDIVSSVGGEVGDDH